ncbi:MAG: sulfatase [Candidatus Latescibacteria bacterium]|jgi:choline-sulfatase|nr:sulfatase [Candidatus Latescibacterota bacterium]
MRILYFDIDSLRPDHLGCYGYGRPTSPTIDKIASQGMRFDHYYCADSPCMPSRHGWITGRYGINNGVVTHGGPASQLSIREQLYGGPDDRNQLVQRKLRQNGLETVCFSNFAPRHCATWFSMGWTEYHSPSLHTGSESAEEVNEPVLRWIENNGARDDYFLYINYWDPHRVYNVDQQWFDRMREHPVPGDWPDNAAIRGQQDINGWFTAANLFPNGAKSPTPNMPDTIGTREDFEHMVTGYDAEIAYTDHQIRRVLDALEAQGVLDETVVIISADHGEAMGEHGVYGDHVCADECINKVPLIIHWPGVTTPGSVCEDYLYNVDFVATLIELTGGQIPEFYDGRSFADGMGTGSCKLHDYLVWGHGLYALQRTVRTPRNLMTRTYDNFGYTFDPVELYDMEKDPYQTRNLRDEQPETVNQMDHYLAEWLHEQQAKPYSIPDPLQVEWQERQKGS